MMEVDEGQVKIQYQQNQFALMQQKFQNQYKVFSTSAGLQSVSNTADNASTIASPSLSSSLSSTSNATIDSGNLDDDATFLQEASISTDLQTVLFNVFGYKSFNEGQEEALRNIAAGRSTFLVLPTGGGKSLCYQLPAFLFPGITLVITPLISLMQDQLERLPACLPGAFWNSQQSSEETLNLMKRLKAGEIKILFVSPEKLLTPGFQRFMTVNMMRNDSSQAGYNSSTSSINGSANAAAGARLAQPWISFACIDEAHCVSEWSHNFRPSYLRLRKVLRDTLRVKAILALTATATQDTEMTVCRSLGIRPEHVVKQSVRRKNLILTVSRDADRKAALVDLLHSKQYKSLNAIIVYVMLQKEADQLAQFLVSKHFDAASYHAGKTAVQRRRLQLKFMNDKLRIVVATVAFGMGLDKQNVRAVIHYSLPRSFENYVQEVGRAGRDGKLGLCHAFFDEGDIIRMKSLAQSGIITSSFILIML
jgi:ATP-dependent DNA helicase Q4